jgi:hypothetical protein
VLGFCDFPDTGHGFRPDPRLESARRGSMTELKLAGEIRCSPRWTVMRPCCENHGHLAGGRTGGMITMRAA